MNIMQLTTHLNVGGIPVYVLELSRRLSKKHRFFIASSGGAMEKIYTDSNINFVRINMKTRSEINPKLIKGYFELCRFMEDQKIDLIHAHTRVGQVLGYFLSKKFNIPLITTCHGFYNPKLTRIIFPLWGDRVIAISNSVHKHLTDKLKVSGDRISVVHNGLDTKVFDPDKIDQDEKLVKDLKLENRLVIGVIARTADVKGHKYLIEAFSQLISTYPNACLLIIGDGNEKENLIKQRNELQLKEKIIFLNSVSDTKPYLKLMDIFVLPSISEGFGFSALEAMAMGIPVIASNTGGLAEILQNGKWGILTRPGSAKEIEEALRIIIENLDEKKKKAKIISEEVRNQFSLDKTVEKIGLIYEEFDQK